MKKSEVIDNLNRKFDSMARYEKESRYFNFYQDYIIYLGKEENYIPQAFNKLLDNKLLSIEDLIILSFIFLVLSNHDTPHFITTYILKKYDFAKKAIIFAESEKEDVTKPEFMNSFPKILNKEEFIFDIEKLHNHLIDTLQDLPSPKVTFKNNILYLNNQEYNFLNKFNQKILLKILFSEPKKEWSYDEIQDEWPLEYQDELKDKTFYTACTAINNRIPDQDLLIFNTSIFRLNPKYTG